MSYRWFGVFLGMASACVVYGFAQTFLIFQLHFFFSIFFSGFCMGPYNDLQTAFYRRNSLLAPKKHPIKEALVKEIARFFTIFVYNRVSMRFWYDFHRPGPLTGPKNQVFFGFGSLEARVGNTRISSKICRIAGLGSSWAWPLHV